MPTAVDSPAHDTKMAVFARTFPSMAMAAGVKPWDANVLDQWAADTPVSRGQFITAQFLLTVWDPANAWRCGRFDLMDAMRVWDGQHRSAFLAWANDPWWP